MSLALILLAIVAASYPLYNGDVTRNWLNPNEKGVPLPDYFFTTDSYRTETGYMLLLPERTTYVTYNFSTLVNFGNPYPILFAKPYISGTGTEYVQSQNSTIIKEVYSLALDKNTTSTLEFYGELGIRYLLLEKCMVLGNTTSLSNITVTNNPHLIVVHEWKEATLYYNPYS